MFKKDLKRPSKKKTYQFGIMAEKIVMIFLRLKGYQILAWRFKSVFGEVDIIAKKKQIVVAIEVKARSKKALVEEILRPKQIARIKKSAELFYLRNERFHNCDLRFDFIEVRKFFFFKHHRNFVG